MAWVLAGGIGHLGPGQVTLKNGVISALFMWVGFVITTLAVNNAFGQRKAAADRYRWHPLAGRARHTGRHHRRDGRVNEA